MIPGEYKSPEKAKDYNTNRFSGNLKFAHIDEMEIVEPWIKPLEKKSIIMDLGAGTGRAIKLLLKFNPKLIYAFDQSPAMLKQLESNYPKEVKQGKVKVVVGSSNKISLSSNSVDVVVSLHVFKHIENIDKTLKEVHRILRSGGFILFDVLNINSIVRFNLGTCYALDKSSIINILGKNEFKAIKITPLHAFGETVYNFPGAETVNLIDKVLIKIGLPGTKFFVLAQKYV